MCWSSTYGCSLQRIRLQPPAHTAAASGAYGCSPRRIYGCSLQRMRLQPPAHAVAAPFTCGCSLLHARLQPPARAVAGERAARGAGGARPREHGPQEGAGRAAAEGPGRVEGRQAADGVARPAVLEEDGAGAQL
eukprot:scaffold28797_cov62-Phaeocystis_antarctica.AAC.1